MSKNTANANASKNPEGKKHGKGKAGTSTESVKKPQMDSET